MYCRDVNFTFTESASKMIMEQELKKGEGKNGRKDRRCKIKGTGNDLAAWNCAAVPVCYIGIFLGEFN